MVVWAGIVKHHHCDIHVGLAGENNPVQKELQIRVLNPCADQIGRLAINYMHFNIYYFADKPTVTSRFIQTKYPLFER